MKSNIHVIKYTELSVYKQSNTQTYEITCNLVSKLTKKQERKKVIVNKETRNQAYMFTYKQIKIKHKSNANLSKKTKRHLTGLHIFKHSNVQASKHSNKSKSLIRTKKEQ